jgi:CHASE2 domain-containing sensor protein
LIIGIDIRARSSKIISGELPEMGMADVNIWFFWSPINLINIFFCAVIVAVSLVAHKRSKDKFILIVAISFGIFGLSHICAMSTLVVHCTRFIALIRSLAYVLIIYALLKKASIK